MRRLGSSGEELTSHRQTCSLALCTARVMTDHALVGTLWLVHLLSSRTHAAAVLLLSLQLKSPCRLYRRRQVFLYQGTESHA